VRATGEVQADASVYDLFALVPSPPRRTAPLESAPFKRGPGGRPTRAEAERRHIGLLSTVFRLFLEKGWDGVSIDEISRQSGIAKRFIYARYPDKSALFAGALSRLMDKASGTLHRVEPLPADVEEGLTAFGRKLLDLMLQPAALALYRQMIAEASRFPELARVFVARSGVREMVAEVLTIYVQRGAIVLAPSDSADPAVDLKLLVEHFAVLVIGVPRTLALLAGRESPAEEDRRLRAAVRLFLDGCRPR
jgi:TetR/AcrR family transcriptional regulator, mexJK operon transcriptional repressor